MKKFLLTLVAGLFCASAAMADATIVMKDAFKSATENYKLEENVAYTYGDFTIKASKGEGSSTTTYVLAGADLRVYAGNTITISAKENMTKLVFNISAQGLKRLCAVAANVGTVAEQKAGDATVTWTGDAKEVTFTVDPEGKKAQFGSDGSGKAGQFDFTSVEVVGGGTVPEGGTTPDTPVVPEGDVYTVAKALAEGAALSSDTIKNIYVSGVIKEIKEVSAQYGNATFFISDKGADNSLQVFRCKWLNNEKFTAENQIEVGKEITVYGNIVNYMGNTVELVNGYVAKYEGGDSPVVPEPETKPQSTYTLATTLAAGNYVMVVNLDGKDMVGAVISQSATYGRLALAEVTLAGDKVTTATENGITIAAEGEGYTLQDSYGRYFGFDGEHTTSFQLYTEKNDFTTWKGEMVEGKAKFTNTVADKTCDLGVTKGTNGTWYTNIALSVGAEEILLPALYKNDGAGVENVMIDANAPVEFFNLQGVRVANPENGIYIRRQGSNVTKVYVK